MPIWRVLRYLTPEEIEEIEFNRDTKSYNL
jgi:hypothetical protein